MLDLQIFSRGSLTPLCRTCKVMLMRLSRYLKVNNLSESEFAGRVPVAHSTVWRIVRGQMTPRPVLRRRLSEATRGEVSEAELLLEGSGIPEPVPGEAEAA